MATIDEVLQALTSPDEDVLVVTKARRLPRDRRAGASSLLPSGPLLYAVVTSERVMFAQRRMFSKHVPASSVTDRPLTELADAVHPRPRLQKQAVQLVFSDDTSVIFELPSSTLSTLWLRALHVARQEHRRWDTLRPVA